LSTYNLFAIFVIAVGFVDIVPVVSVTLVISVFAPDAAALRFVLAPDAVVDPVPPLATGTLANSPTTPELSYKIRPVVPPVIVVVPTVKPLAPEAAAQEPSPRKNVVTDGVPVALIPPTGRPVAFVRVTEVGVPRTGVTSVGLVARTTLPEPVVAFSPITPELSYRI
jgi:hypothetical protein